MAVELRIRNHVAQFLRDLVVAFPGAIDAARVAYEDDSGPHLEDRTPIVQTRIDEIELTAKGLPIFIVWVDPQVGVTYEEHISANTRYALIPLHVVCLYTRHKERTVTPPTALNQPQAVYLRGWDWIRVMGVAFEEVIRTATVDNAFDPEVINEYVEEPPTEGDPWIYRAHIECRCRYKCTRGQ